MVAPPAGGGASELHNRAKPENRGVGNTPHERVQRIDHPAPRMKDILKIRLNEKTRPDLRLVGRLKQDLAVSNEDRDLGK